MFLRFAIAVLLAFIPGLLSAEDVTDTLVEQLNGHFSKGVRPNQNAVVAVYEAFGPHPEKANIPDEFFARLGMPVPPENGHYFQPFPYGESNKDQFNKALEGPWKAKDAPAVIKWLKDNEKPIDIVVKGLKRRHWYSPIVRWSDKNGQKQSLLETLLPGTQQIRSIARSLSVRANLAIGEERYEDAWVDILNCHRLGRMQARGSTLIDYLVGAACCNIAGEVHANLIAKLRTDSDSLRRLRKQFRSLPEMPVITSRITVTERIMIMDVYDSLKAGRYEVLEAIGIQNSGGEIAKVSPAQKAALALIDWDRARIRAVETFDEIEAILPIRNANERAVKMAEFNKGIEQKKAVGLESVLKQIAINGNVGDTVHEAISDALLAELLPAMGAVDKAKTRLVARTQNLDIFPAIELYRNQNGQYPKSLAALKPTLLSAEPVDPFTSTAIKYRRTKDGFVMYSVGENKKDDAGRTYGENGGDDLRVRVTSGKVSTSN